MFTLYGLPTLPGLRQPSPWVMKVELALRALGLEYTLENISPFRIMTFGPTGRVPFLVSESISLNESERIVGSIELYGESKSYPQPADQNDEVGIAFVRLVEDHFYNIICLAKYSNRNSFSSMLGELIPNLPSFAIWLMANFGERIIKKRMSGTSIDGLTDSEIAQEAEKDIAALSRQLSKNGFIASKQLTVYDFTIAAHIAAIFFYPFDNWLTPLMKEDRVFHEYLERVAHAVGGFEYVN